ncbi:hypothetical protein ACHAXH_002609 [Discostella pseudostelligera]
MMQLLLLLGPRCSRVGAYHISSYYVRRRDVNVILTLSQPHAHRRSIVAASNNSYASSSLSFGLHPSGLTAHLNGRFAPRSSARMIHHVAAAAADAEAEADRDTDIESRTSADDSNKTNDDDDNYDMNNNTPPNSIIPPWSLPSLKSASSKTYSRFRQHVNPLSRRYSMSAELPPNWPYSVFDNVELPLYLDVGCGKGGFLLELAGAKERGRRNAEGGNVMTSTTYNDDDEEEEDESNYDAAFDTLDATSSSSSSLWPLPPHMNYLGLEIRPVVSQYAQARVTKRKLDGVVSFVGCNVNVDLDRLLTLYHESNGDDGILNNNYHRRLAFVSIQFPDPHFKKAHNKRRVVTDQLVSTLAKFMEEGSAVFLQSDVKDALVSMREKFVEEEEEEELDEEDATTDRVDGRRNEREPLGAAGYFDEILVLSNGTTAEVVEYAMANPIGVPTEREKSVLAQGLPVYRTMFRRNGIAFESYS